MTDIADALQDLIAIWRPGGSVGLNDPSETLVREIIARAERDPAGLRSALKAALDETARRIDHVSIAVTGLAWLGSGAPSVQQEMIALARSTKREITLCAYSVTAAALPLFSEIRETVEQGTAATIIVNGFSTQSPDVKAYLTEAAGRYGDHWRLFDFEPTKPQTDLHAKIMVVDRAAALVGSANLSFHGMVSNHELAVIIRGPTAERIAERLDLLIKSARPAIR